MPQSADWIQVAKSSTEEPEYIRKDSIVRVVLFSHQFVNVYDSEGNCFRIARSSARELGLPGKTTYMEALKAARELLTGLRDELRKAGKTMRPEQLVQSCQEAIADVDDDEILSEEQKQSIIRQMECEFTVFTVFSPETGLGRAGSFRKPFPLRQGPPPPSKWEVSLPKSVGGGYEPATAPLSHEEAMKIAQEVYGADAEGRIYILNRVTSEG